MDDTNEHSGNQNGSKEDAKYWRKQPGTEKMMRQWLKMESGAYSRPSYCENYDTSMADEKTVEHDKLVKPAPCDQCDYIATTDAEVDWHETRNLGHVCCPDHVREP